VTPLWTQPIGLNPKQSNGWSFWKFYLLVAASQPFKLLEMSVCILHEWGLMKILTTSKSRSKHSMQADNQKSNGSCVLILHSRTHNELGPYWEFFGEDCSLLAGNMFCNRLQTKTEIFKEFNMFWWGIFTSIEWFLVIFCKQLSPTPSNATIKDLIFLILNSPSSPSLNIFSYFYNPGNLT
jgi:hypothetical protein